MEIDHLRWTYEQIAKQIEREDNLYQARLSSCIVVNLALLAAVATQINLPALDLKNLIIILGCAVAGCAITSGIRSGIAAGEAQLRYLRGLFGDLARGRSVPLVRPYVGGDDPKPDRKDVSHLWTSITLVLMLMWVAIGVLALLVFLSPKFREILTWLNQTST